MTAQEERDSFSPPGFPAPSPAPAPRLRIGFILARRFTLCAFANFVDVLRLAADPRLPRLAAGGRLVLSGIAAQREREVRGALKRAGFRIGRRLEEAWWIGLLAVRDR